jgi:Xaa-Pro aminopeptidase
MFNVKHPFVLFAGVGDQDFRYASGFEVERGVYLSFAPGDDLLILSTLELDRAREESRAARIVDRLELGWRESDNPVAAWAGPILAVLRERGLTEVHVPAALPAALYQALNDGGLETVIEPRLLVEARRRKTPDELRSIHAALRASEAACVEVVRRIAAAEIRNGLLWEEGRPLTSEHLIALASGTLQELGYQSVDLIVAGSPGSALPHNRGSGQLRAGSPIVLDIFPQGRSTGYHADMTRTVVAGPVDKPWQRVSDAVLAAFDAGVAELRPGGDGQKAMRAACQALVDAGYGTSTAGYEGKAGLRLTHGLGHGIGLDVHEDPFVRDHPIDLVEGDVLTFEPGLYQLGLGGIRWEDTGVIEADGFRSFNTLPKSLDPNDYL